MLHVRCLPIRIHSTNSGGGCRRRGAYDARIVEPRIQDREGLLIGRIHANNLLGKTDQILFVKDPVTRANCSASLSEWIPSQTNAWGKVTARSLSNFFTERRNSRRAVYSSLKILRVD